jgi:hypothetical protein
MNRQLFQFAERVANGEALDTFDQYVVAHILDVIDAKEFARPAAIDSLKALLAAAALAGATEEAA